jgi:hypothetical protein
MLIPMPGWGHRLGNVLSVLEWIKTLESVPNVGSWGITLRYHEEEGFSFLLVPILGLARV